MAPRARARWLASPDDLASAAGRTLTDRVASLVVTEIQRGRLAPGARLPGSRPLARSLGVDRDTVQRALASLELEGWLVARERAGVFVAATVPSRTPRTLASPRARIPSRAGFSLAGLDDALALEDRDVVFDTGAPVRFDLSTGMPDLRLAPIDALQRAYRRAFASQPFEALSYGDPRGHRALRQALARLLADTRALATHEDGVVVTQGSQHALDLIARLLVRPGDRVAVEVPGYRVAWRAFALAGAELVPIAVDARGLDVDALAAAHRAKPLRAVYGTPHHQYPTMAVLAPERRQALLALAAAGRFAIVEDDYDHELHFDGRPLAPLASVDRAGVVLYVGTLSKLVAPGLRVGFAVVPSELVAPLTRLRSIADRQGDPARDLAVASLLDDGSLERHVRRAKRAYEARRQATVEILTRVFGDELVLAVPPGGLALWPTLSGRRASSRLVALQRALVAHGVRLDVGGDFVPRGARATPSFRIGFASLDDEERGRAYAIVRRLWCSL